MKHVFYPYEEQEYGESVSKYFPEIFPEKPEGSNLSYEKPAVTTVTWQVSDACNLCCFPAGTKILMADFTYKNIEDIALGDEVMSFDKKSAKGKQMTLSKTKVTHLFSRHDTTRLIKTEKGESIVTTAEHPFLDDRKQWRRAEDITPSTKVMMFDGISESDIPVVDKDYKVGYVVGAWLGDGTMTHYKNGDLRDIPNRNCQNRFVVKDEECTNILAEYTEAVGIPTERKPFAFGKDTFSALFVQGKRESELLKELIETNISNNSSISYAKGFLAAMIDTEGSIGGSIRITNTSERIIAEITRCAKTLGLSATIANVGATKNQPNKWTVTVHGNLLNALSMIRPVIRRKSVLSRMGGSDFNRSTVTEVQLLEGFVPVYNMETESHVYIANNFLVHNCSYCYQHNKGHRVMSFETAKELVDRLFDGEEGFDKYVTKKSPGIILEFIGGEPFLQTDLIDKTVDYFRYKAIELDHPWATFYKLSICSNGTLYHTAEVQEFLKKHEEHLSFNITLDGNKQLHDSCRVFEDGSGSFDLAHSGIEDWRNTGHYMGSKLTVAPGNIDYLDEALMFMMKEGYANIHANCVFEEGWTYDHAKVLYQKLKKTSQFLNDNDLTDKIYVAFFDEERHMPMSHEDNQNFCGGTGGMLAMDPDGNLYPCLRYMESSVGDNVPPFRIGNVYEGLLVKPEDLKKMNCMACITRRSQSTDECWDCPIAAGCSWCSAYNYEKFGTADHRATFICCMHKAESLANVFHWNTYYRKHNLPYRFKMWLPKEEALKIISEEEYEMLYQLQELK